MPTNEEVLRLITERLRPHLDIQRVVLFGSRARGDHHPDSDFDVLVIAESDVPFIKRQRLAQVWVGRKNFPLDLLVYTPEEAAEAASILGTAVCWAEREGIQYATH